MPVNWVDNSTPVNTANLEVMEADTAAAKAVADAAQPKTEKAQANGYASLDGTGKVPLAQLPPVGADLEYSGDYASGSFSDGDIVVSDGIAYLCVKDTTTPPEPWPGGPTPIPPAPTVPYGTTLPASPVDGQEAILVDSVTAPTYQWRFRYNAQSSSAYKWEFVGGTSASSQVGDPGGVVETTTLTSYNPLATAGPSVVVPRAGDYYLRWGTWTRHNTANQACYMGIRRGATSTAHADAVIILPQTTEIYMSRSKRFNGLTAGMQLLAEYMTTSGTAGFLARWLEVTPVRVS